MKKPPTPLRVAIFDSGEKQVKIAKRAKIHPSRLSRLARGHERPSIDEQDRIAKAIGRPVAEVFPEA